MCDDGCGKARLHFSPCCSSRGDSAQESTRKVLHENGEENRPRCAARRTVDQVSPRRRATFILSLFQTTLNARIQRRVRYAYAFETSRIKREESFEHRLCSFDMARPLSLSRTCPMREGRAVNVAGQPIAFGIERTVVESARCVAAIIRSSQIITFNYRAAPALYIRAFAGERA